MSINMNVCQPLLGYVPFLKSSDRGLVNKDSIFLWSSNITAFVH